MDATMMETDQHDPKPEYEHSEDPSSSQMDEVCPICHISVGAETPDNVVESWASLPCGHRFGSYCLKSWLGMAEPPACPMCRKDMAHICGHPYLPRPVAVTAPSPSDGGDTHVEDPSAKQAEGDHTTQSGTGGAADGAQDSQGLRRRSRRLMAKEAAAAAAAAATAGRVAATAGPAVPAASAPIAIPSSPTYQRPSTPPPSFSLPSSSPDSSSSSASSPVFSSSSVSSGSVPASPLSALSIHVGASSSVEVKAATKTGAVTSPARPLSLETLFPRAPPMDAACTYCFGFLEKQYKEELHAEEAATAAAEEKAKAREAVAMTVEVVIPDAPADSDGANIATGAMDGSEALSDNENEDEDEDEASEDDEDDNNMIITSCTRKDRIVQMAMGVFASGCADPSRLSSEERRKVAAHWERWRISHGKMFSAWWAEQAPETEPAIERRTQGWVH